MNEHKVIFQDLHHRQDVLLKDISEFKEEMCAFEVGIYMLYFYGFINNTFDLKTTEITTTIESDLINNNNKQSSTLKTKTNTYPFVLYW